MTERVLSHAEQVMPLCLYCDSSNTTLNYEMNVMQRCALFDNDEFYNVLMLSN